jgi:hypothetical protein
MPSSLFVERAHQFAESLGDDDAKISIEHYLRHCAYPGPTVMFVGAAGRGKSTLLAKAARITLDPSAATQFAGDVAWKKTVREMAAPNSVFHAAESSSVGETLLCDGPSFGTADLAVMAVQITQPAGMDEVNYVKEHLSGIPSVLVLTKCDQVDKDDFQEGLEAILENYGVFPWLAVLLSDIDGNLTETTAHGQLLQTFEQWWKNEGQDCAEKAREAHQNQLQQAWRDRARMILESKEQEYAPQFEIIKQSLASTSGANEAQQIQDELMRGLKILPDQALAFYRNRIPELRLNVNRITYQYTDSVKGGAEIDLSQITQALRKFYQEWDQEVRSYVDDELKPSVESLRQKAMNYEEHIRTATNTKATTEMARDRASRQDVFIERENSQKGIELQGNFDLSISDKLRSVATPTVTAIGTGMLLMTVVGATVFSFFAPGVALVGAIAAGIGTSGSLTDANQRRRANDLREAIGRQSAEYEHQLQQQLYSDWKRFSDDVRDSVSASKRRLSILMMHQSPGQDREISQKHKELSSKIALIGNLRSNLRWLVDHEQDAPPVASREA